ncbi:MAG: 4-hydroxy-3-methylbut-2-enyl diphosphate reductase, partial [Oscillospiraceae bacterium]
MFEKTSRMTLAKTAGFCFGVNRAVNIVYDLLEKGKKVATLGPIIHNPQMVDKLKNLGVRIIKTPNQAEKDEIIVIRSHGVSQKIYDEIKDLGNEFIDATCPYVGKIHKIVNENSKNGNTIIIAGDKLHPEVIGIQGHCNGKNYVIGSVEELINLSYELTQEEKNRCVLVAQTTFNQTLWKDCIKIAKKLYTNAKKFDTICNATNERQTEAKNLATRNEIMLVIGGKESSNTKKLFDVCEKYTKTFLIETKDELQSINFLREDNIGLTAGASTPAYIIKEVLKTM